MPDEGLIDTEVKLTFVPDYKREFTLYVLWRSLPPLFKGQGLGFYEKLGIDDPLLCELLDIRSQMDFSKKFGVSGGALSRWNSEIESSNVIAPAMVKWLAKLTPNIMAAFYKSTMKEADSARVKLWLEYVEKWIEKSETQHGVAKSLADVLNTLHDESEKQREPAQGVAEKSDDILPSSVGVQSQDMGQV